MEVEWSVQVKGPSGGLKVQDGVVVVVPQKIRFGFGLPTEFTIEACHGCIVLGLQNSAALSNMPRLKSVKTVPKGSIDTVNAFTRGDGNRKNRRIMRSPVFIANVPEGAEALVESSGSENGTPMLATSYLCGGIVVVSMDGMS